MKSLYAQLKMQDKEEVQYKQNLKETDTDGTIAGKLREKLLAIMKTYNLLDLDGDHQNNKYAKPEKYDKYHKDKSDQHANKVGMFKDKKLNKLLHKAEMAGFTPTELKTLKDEFSEYEKKVDMYYELIDNLDENIKNRYESMIDVISRFYFSVH